MKKISPKQYAVALYQVIKDKQGNQLNQAFDNFLQLVRQNKDWKNLDKIVKAFAKVYLEEENLSEATVVTAREIPDALLAKIKKWLEESGQKSVSLKKEIDPSLLGGLVIRQADSVLDASLKTKLKKLQFNLNK
ncbi:MAG TPA: ATP synthase F1 subunit delta [Patescibacteria group bacterium]|nr:ATP synthase F1 subunit delta [Patescibacteria group bacterium]